MVDVQLKNTIQSLIANSETINALDKLKFHFQNDAEKQKTITLLFSRTSEIKKKVLTGLITEGEYQKTLMNVNLAILSVLDEEKDNLPSKIEEKKSKHKWEVLFLSALLFYFIYSIFYTYSPELLNDTPEENSTQTQSGMVFADMDVSNDLSQNSVYLINPLPQDCVLW